MPGEDDLALKQEQQDAVNRVNADGTGQNLEQAFNLLSPEKP
jgi:hypothetical protein